jgi:hypothetical protein
MVNHRDVLEYMDLLVDLDNQGSSSEPPLKKYRKAQICHSPGFFAFQR